LTAFT